jgi:fatty-acyl-CoA synthase
VPLVQFSSGSTAAPKGVIVGSDALVAHVKQLCDYLRLDSSGAVASWLPLYHDLGLVGILLTSLCARADLHMCDPSSFARNPLTWVKLCANASATHTAAPASAYKFVSDFADRRRAAVPRLSTMRVWLCGGERTPWSAMRRFYESLQEMGVRWETLMPAYGLAEATLAVAITPLGEPPTCGDGDLASAGVPLDGVEVQIAPEGQTIRVRGPSVSRSYLTAAGPVPTVDRDGWLETSDVGSFHEGRLYVHGRSDEALVVYGRNVCAEDAESVVERALGTAAASVAAFRADELAPAFALVVEIRRRYWREAESIANQARLAVADALTCHVGDVLVCKPGTIDITTSGKPKRASGRSLQRGDHPNSYRILHRG